MTLADVRKWAHAARSDACQARALATKLGEADDNSRAELCAKDREATALSLLRAARFARAAMPNGGTKEEGRACR